MTNAGIGEQPREGARRGLTVALVHDRDFEVVVHGGQDGTTTANDRIVSVSRDDHDGESRQWSGL